MLIAFNKPYGMLCQFTGTAGQTTLADAIAIPNIYAAGRLDAESEGLLLLTDNGQLQQRISHPKQKLPKTYWAQVEGIATSQQITQLCAGVVLKDGPTRTCQVRPLSVDTEDRLWQRTPPIRFRANQPTTWLELILTEGKNRQVRRMTAAVGLPTLRLVRVEIGAINLFATVAQPLALVELPESAVWLS